MKKIWIIVIISSLFYSNSLFSQGSDELFEAKLFDLIKYDQKFVPDYFNGDGYQTISIRPSLNFMVKEDIALKISGSQFLELNNNKVENNKNYYTAYEIFDIGVGYFPDKNKEIALNTGVIHDGKFYGYSWDLAFKFYVGDHVYFSSGFNHRFMDDENIFSFYVGSGFRIF
ncbi:MAG: hypothetical protein K9J21_10885 [Bacteroidales bacterium]|nr:hypothetical protein [Bacteroidales bacterium]